MPNNPDQPQNENQAIIQLLSELVAISREEAQRTEREGGGLPAATAGDGLSQGAGRAGGGGVGGAIAARLRGSGGRGVRVQGAAAQALVSSGLGGARAALGRAGLPGLALQAGIAHTQFTSQSIQTGLTNGGNAAQGLNRTNRIFNMINSAVSGLSGGVLQPFIEGKVAQGGASFIDSEASSMVAGMQANARAKGVPLSDKEVFKATNLAQQYAEGQLRDKMVRELATDKLGASKALLKEAARGQNRGTFMGERFGGVGDAEAERQAANKLSRQRNKILKQLLQALKTNRELSNRGNR